MAVLVTVMTASMQWWAPDFVGEGRKPRRPYLVVNLGYSILFAMAGGYVTAWLSPNKTLVHALILAITVLLLSGLSAVQTRGRQSLTYQLLLLVLTPLGVLGGGLARLWQSGVRW